MDSVANFIFLFHREEVYQVEWDPNHETLLASSSSDRRLMIWDLNRYFKLKNRGYTFFIV